MRGVFGASSGVHEPLAVDVVAFYFSFVGYFDEWNEKLKKKYYIFGETYESG